MATALQMITQRAFSYVKTYEGLQNCLFNVISHYCNVIMGVMASQITSLTIVYSTVHSGADLKKHQSSASLAFGFPAQMASNAEMVSIWWRHHDVVISMLCYSIAFHNDKVPNVS